MGQPDSTVAEKHAGSAASPPTMPAQVMFIADWRIDPAANRISRRGKDVKVQPKVMEVLMYLAQRPGELITRRALDRGNPPPPRYGIRCGRGFPAPPPLALFATTAGAWNLTFASFTIAYAPMLIGSTRSTCPLARPGKVPPEAGPVSH